jgi:hypothetical protein
MRRTFLLLLLGMLALSASSSASVIWDLTPLAGNPIGVQITVEDDIAPDTLRITASVLPAGGNTIGDLRGIFFNIDGGVGGVTESMFSGVGFTIDTAGNDKQVCLGSNIDECGSNSNNVNGPSYPAGSFQVAIEIGSQGIGSDDFQTAVILFNYGALGLTPEDLGPFAARVMSIGTVGGSREGSAKLYSGPDPREDQETVVPEPSTWLMMGAGLALVTLAKIRRTRRS